MIDDTNFADKVEEVVANYLQTSAFTDKKVTDTPTDALQIANKKYVDSAFFTSVVDTDVTLAADSDSKVASQKATKTYVDTAINTVNAKIFTGIIDLGTQSSAATIALASSHIYTVTINGTPVTLSVTGETVGVAFIIRLTQASGGSKTVAWFSTIRWPGAVTPTLTTTAGKTDVFGFLCTAAGSFDGFILGQNL